MRNVYLANGFLQTTVDGQALDNYQGKEGDLVVRFAIQEGKQTRVASLNIDGIHAFKQDELLNVVASTPGQPYSEFNVETDRDNILALYFNEGFPEERFTATAEHVNAESNKGRAGSHNTTQASAADGMEKSEKTNKRTPVVYQGELIRPPPQLEERPPPRVQRILLPE